MFYIVNYDKDSEIKQCKAKFSQKFEDIIKTVVKYLNMKNTEENIEQVFMDRLRIYLFEYDLKYEIKFSGFADFLVFMITGSFQKEKKRNRKNITISTHERH